MATYWKSQPKKFCDFCKCWITDNKPSVDFHEKGKKHQENVKRKIDEVRRKSTKDAEKKEEAAEDFRKMEEAALEAFKKDLAENPELAAQYSAKIKAAKEKQNEGKEELEKEQKSEGEEEEEESTPEDAGEWLEATSPEGYSYYWHTITQEPVWVAPEKFVSLEEQKKREEKKAKEESGQLMAAEENPVEPEYTSASNIDTETLLGMSFGPQPQQPVKNVYGSWITTSDNVVRTEDEPVPIEPVPVDCIPLPGECELPPDQPSDQQQKPKKDKFKEKKVTSLGGADGEPVAFKKRKIASGARNTRRRDNDD
ncbi:WW domain-binding protein 4-like [Mizuhopecten yessoensis]|uniref:WW domain-binding protein 4 n=1 Tax=Mizuhopecten yessoensis TaxID=6573 RepID=A0A210R1T7_MIZYE|nr:WW domain-binding protein 4-like [Mizuhopecten yessoensis]OWF54998.1 WW domain-binding protein 4 [Mizuhopecten yessoensis]